jgi:sec-independent protein translocase protein TatC
MAKKNDEDDLFQHTAMTFGEHLEELRAALFKAVISIGIGFAIGLWFAPNIVQMIQSPLENALDEYYRQEAEEFVAARLPPELQKDEAARSLVWDQGLIPQEAFVDPRQVLKELRAKSPAAAPAEILSTAAAPAAPRESGPPETAATSASEPAAKTAAPATVAEAKQFTKEDMLRVFVWHPLSDDDRMKVKNFNPQESFVIYIKAAFLFGAIVASPFAFYFLWSFVAAGLYPHERKYIHTFLPASVSLFIAGASLAFFAVFPPVLRFFFGITKSMGQGIEPRISEWMSFVLLLPLGFGVAFQLPLVMLFLERIRIFTVKAYLAKWRVAVLLMAIAAMILSPGGDPYSMMMMLGPLILLYFGGIALCHWFPAHRGVAVEKAD